ncbi:NTP transferase domain-containing protein [Mycolicibacterium sp. F2034L]|uniref:nucleotidyltransferase family protein n=1 Tax=Mycolicibacterium sp. F2034L TaxID=2926422 RepID=UPI001FF31ADF|nr:NTP transferase domain-containing protein [Mycolicibacterium sp. F2034L]MCK0174563.1 NTP transferase domain-containing protein [Mycolicibacterium sp. F2034L]
MSTGVTAAGVLLAAGAGTRFGMPKVLAGEGEWLRIAVRALADGGCDDVLVVLGAAVVEVPAPARAVVADDWADGLSASVRAGILAAGDADVAVLHTVDTPDIGAAAVRRVLDAAAAGVARAVYGGRPGHPVAIARRHWPALLDSLHGDDGARPFLRERDDVMRVECGDLSSGEDVDTADLSG